MDFTDMTREAESLDVELYRAEANPIAIGPTVEELRAFLQGAASVTPPDCEECDGICGAANKFDRAVCRESFDDAAEALIDLLCRTSGMRAPSMRALLGDFLTLAIARHKEQNP